MAPSDDGVEEARSLLAGARSIAVVTGAGISAESGVPTFRGPEGLWRSHRPEDLATPEAFRRDPCLVWAWYAWRRSVVADCRPNAGHLALARLALERGPEAVTLITQNVDGLHGAAAGREAAGHPEAPGHGGGGVPWPGAGPEWALPLELHGALFRDRCTRCGARTPGDAAVDTSSPAALPRCGACGGLLRPDVVWFGEALDPGVLARAFAAARGAEVCLVVGTSSLVHPAASLPLATLGAGGAVVEVNPEPTPLTPHARIALRGGAARLLPLLLVPQPAPAPVDPDGAAGFP